MAGLLTGQDLVEQLDVGSVGEVMIVPDVMLRDGDTVFLDDMSISVIEERLNVQVEVVPSDPWGLWDMLDTLAMERASGHYENNTGENL